jgi:hypothetical protein
MKSKKMYSFSMKIFIAFFVFLGLNEIYSQPLSGNYTIGGNSPDFNTFQEAVNALVGNGVSGPATFLIRPGLYTEQAGAAPVMMLEAAVAGVSESNSITFKPDESSGGNVNNTILEINGGTPPAGGRTAISVNVDYVTISSLTVRDVDTSGSFANSLIRLRGRGGQGIIRGIKILGCRLLGSPVFNEIPTFSAGSRGTVYGIWLDKTNLTQFDDITITENYIEKSNYGIFVNAGLTITNVNINSNVIKAIHNKVTGSPANIGAGIHFARIDASLDLYIKNNVIDFAGGGGAPASGIALLTEQSGRYIKAVVDGNYIINRPGKLSGGTFQTNGFSAINVGSNFNTSNDILISNNMVAGNFIRQTGGPLGTRWGIKVSCNNTRLYHNTIVNPYEILISGTNDLSIAVEIDRENIEVINNIIIEYAKNNSGNSNSYAYAIKDTTGLISDYNIFDITSGQKLAFVLGVGNFALGLSQLQALTGRDSSSFVKTIEFEDSVNLHLTNCQMQDPDLVGIPLPEVIVDFDGDIRNPNGPTIGADEAVLNNYRHWVDPFQVSLPGSPFSIAAEKFSNIVAADIAVPDFDNNQILLYKNLGPSRAFQQSGTLSTPFSPIAVTFYDFDNDGNLDLIAGGQNTDGIKVFWGDGSGGFPQSTDVQTPGAVSNLLPEPYPISADTQTIFVPFGEFLGILRNFGNRQLCFEFLYGDVFGHIDTLPNFIHGATMEDLNNNGLVDLTGIDHTSGQFVLLEGMQYIEQSPSQCGDPSGAIVRFGPYIQYPFETANYSESNSIVKGDFDGDGDLDFVTTGLIPGTVIFIRYEDNYNFSYSIIQIDDFAQAVVSLDYDNDGDLDFVTANYSTSNGITLFLNDGSANFSQARSCFQDLIEGFPRGIVASDFDLDGRTDIAVTTSFDQFAVLYNADGPTSVEQQQNNLLPNEYVLEQNYPNPFNPTTTIEFSMPQSGMVNLAVYNILGEQVKALINEERTAGKHSVQFNANHLASGIYFYQLQAGSFTQTKKMILLK